MASQSLRYTLVRCLGLAGPVIPMRTAALLSAFVWLCLVGCNKDRSSPAATTPPTKETPQAESDNPELRTCIKHQAQEEACGEYRVLSYDATWRNEHGNEGDFMLEREGLSIRAFCGSENCATWANSVGKTVVADKNITGLIDHRNPSCEDPLYVKNAIEYHKRMTGKTATEGQVCDEILVVEKIEAKPSK